MGAFFGGGFDFDIGVVEHVVEGDVESELVDSESGDRGGKCDCVVDRVGEHEHVCPYGHGDDRDDVGHGCGSDQDDHGDTSWGQCDPVTVGAVDGLVAGFGRVVDFDLGVVEHVVVGVVESELVDGEPGFGFK